MTRFTHTLTILVASLGAAACTGSVEETPTDDPVPGSTTGGTDTTFDHENDGISPWDVIDRLTKEGPATFSSHMHGCAKVRYSNLGGVLADLGVNVNSNTNLSAGQLYRQGGNAMGTANFANRVRENIAITASGSSKIEDIFAAAAPEIITALPTLARCQVGGVPAKLFDAGGCVAEGITCLIGKPAQTGHVEICNLTLQRASDQTVGQRLAVATLLAAAYTCE